MTYEHSTEICTLASHIEGFIQERKFLRGVTASTLAWYRHSFQAFQPVLEQNFASTAAFKTAVIARIGELQTAGRGNKAVSINTYLRCLKAFLKWAHEEKILKEPIKLSWLKEENNVLATFTVEHVKAFMNFKPVSTSVNRYGSAVRSLERLHMAVCVLLDTGLRISEALSLTRAAIDMDNCVLRVRGKGQKERLVPISFELRKRLFRYLKTGDNEFVFCNRNGGAIRQRDFLRDFKKMGERLGITGIRISPHTCRHTFAVMYLKNGGNLEYLRRILGHTSIETTQKYLRSIGIEQVQEVHQRFSPLAQRP
jgi:integrase/recombinase XerD